jgi:5'(3')-deoxyribonucleotidase
VWLNSITLTLIAASVITYRWVHNHLTKGNREKRHATLVIGVDMDGVLADQVTGILDVANARYGTSLSYEDVREWRLPIGSTDIAELIAAEMADTVYVGDMPVHPGAKRMMQTLEERGRAYVVTARPPVAEPATQDWLLLNRIPHNGLILAEEGKKHLHALDVLIDDYTGNIAAFLDNGPGRAILVDQPWNRDREHLEKYITNGRLQVVSSLDEVPALLP